MRMVGPLFLPWVQEVIRDDEVAVIFLKEFWPRTVGDGLAKSSVAATLAQPHSEVWRIQSRRGAGAPGDGSALDFQGIRF